MDVISIEWVFACHRAPPWIGTPKPLKITFDTKSPRYITVNFTDEVKDWLYENRIRHYTEIDWYSSIFRCYFYNDGCRMNIITALGIELDITSNLLAMKFDAYEFKEEVKNWLAENKIKTYCGVHYGEATKFLCYIDNDADIILFKMRWL